MTLTERGRIMWRETQFQSFNATIFLQSREGGHPVQGNQCDRFGIQPHDGVGMRIQRFE